MSNLLTVQNLKKHYKTNQGPLWNRTTHTVKAVDGVSFTLKKDQTMGLVGESGCGKTTTGMMLVGLEDPTEGNVVYNGENLHNLNALELKEIRRNMQIVFQDPFSSLDPMWSLGQIIAEPLVIHGIDSKTERLERTAVLLELVGLDGTYATRYPHELSGGQRQRVAIARALALEPTFIIADEPTSALDVSVKAQIINLFEELQESIGLSMIFISHDLSVVYHICDYIQVMYLGKIVESGPTELIFSNPIHPYTKVLLESIPIANPGKRRKQKLSYNEHLKISGDFLGSEYSFKPFGEKDGKEDLYVVEPDHFVRCFRE